MRKTRIFIKIYLWFWLATALVVATQMTLDHLTESGPPFKHIRHELGKPLAFFGQMAMDHYLRGEISSLSHLARLFKESTGIDAYLLDKGWEVGNRQLQDGSAQLAARVAQSGALQTSLLHDTLVVALPVSAGETGRFIVVGEAAFRPPPPPFMRPPLAGARILIVLTVSGLVCYSLARYLTSSVIVLRQATRRFAAGDLSVRVGRDIGKRKDEFSELANDFNYMAEQIGLLMALQKQLLADISHELRSPLARLKVALELVRRQTGPEMPIAPITCPVKSFTGNATQRTSRLNSPSSNAMPLRRTSSISRSSAGISVMDFSVDGSSGTRSRKRCN